ncbi:MAG: pirin family protein [Thermaerobacter sp.]|nr:pirin family protein [Thermaerobacter sp.]
MSEERRVTDRVAAAETQDGAGARVRRAIGSSRLPYLDPFLLLDEFSIAPPAGFPDHPHRGFELLTYVLDGELHHADSTGNREVLGGGALQKIRVGRGLVHSELPGPGGAHGLQLWVNLPAARKKAEPEYLTLPTTPEVSDPPAKLRLVAGERTLVNFDRPLLYWDVTLSSGVLLRPVPADWTLFTYGLEGTARYGPERLAAPAGELLIWSAGDTLRVEATQETRFVVVASPPIGEPVHRWGPFVD